MILLQRFAIQRINPLILLSSYHIKRYFRPKKPKKINLNSKKIVFIGHSYHAKTKSTDFILNYLKENYDVEIILDESWINGKSFPDLSFVDDSYLAVIFWQNLPSPEALAEIKNENLLFFPMYDAVGGLDVSWWLQYENLKIISFSETLHKKLERFGLDSMHIQYFPKPENFSPGNKNEVFFWQRITNVNINTIADIFKKDRVKLHIHKGVDPDHEFIQPTSEAEKIFQITYSDWFESRDEMLEKIGGLIKQKGIYIAPREYEGIGLSYLEAMAMGKAVIAVDNPTMNEYIKHGINGYLFNLKSAQKN